MKLGFNVTPHHLKHHIINANTYTLFEDFMVLDVYKIDTKESDILHEYNVEILFTHQVNDYYYQNVQVISAPSIHTLNIYIMEYMRKTTYEVFMNIDLNEVREYPTKQDLYLHALVEYGATSLKVKLRQLGLM